MKLTCVTAVFNVIKSGNRENLIRCVRSVAALKTPHEHLIYDGGSTDGTVELLRELEREVRVKSPSSRADGLNSDSGNEPCRGGEGVDGRAASMRPPRGGESDADEKSVSTVEGESGALIERTLPEADNSATSHFSLLTSHSTLRVVSEPDTGIYNALNKGVRDAKGEWFYVLGCDDYISHPATFDRLIETVSTEVELIVAPTWREGMSGLYSKVNELKGLSIRFPYSHQSVIMRTQVLLDVGGFDERYRLCADWAMLMKCYAQKRTFWYTDDPVAYYAAGGLSESDARAGDEVKAIYSKFWRLGRIEAIIYGATGFIPLQKLLACRKHRDPVVRASVDNMAGYELKAFLRIVFWPIVTLRRRFLIRGNRAQKMRGCNGR